MFGLTLIHTNFKKMASISNLAFIIITMTTYDSLFWSFSTKKNKRVTHCHASPTFSRDRA